MSRARRSLAGCVLLCIALLSPGCERSQRAAPGPDGATAAIPAAKPPASSKSFSRLFADITAQAGIRFRHVTGGYGEKLLPETLGSGAAFLDFDGDRKLDLFLVNSDYWPGHAPPGAERPACALYRGGGDGTFQDVTRASGAGVSLYGMGCAVADYDGDGDEDIYVTAAGDNLLLRNDGGSFHDATREAGVTSVRWQDRKGVEHPEWSTAAAWADVDSDGDIDLFVANYVEWSPASEIFTTIDGINKAFTTPDRYPGLPCRLFLNRGDGSFEQATAGAGLAADRGKALGVALWDFDRNGLMDIVVANDTRPNFLFLNRGGARFEELGLGLGIAYDESGRARAGMGIDIADYANDGAPGVAIGNFSGEPMSLYRWHEKGAFSSDAARAGLAQATFAPLTFGVEFLDLDLDGCQDLVLVNGHIEPDIAKHSRDQSYAQSAQIFRGRGDGAFDDVTAAAGRDFVVPRVGRGLAAGDIDGDGDLDLVITTNGGAPVLLKNERTEGSGPSHFLRLRLHGKGKNASALGATVRLTAGGVTQTRLVRTGSSYLSQNESTLTFGLGKLEAVDRLTIRWPDGAERDYPITAIDRTLEIAEE